MKKMKTNPALNRMQLLVGKDVLEKLADTRVIIFGIGGVGSWCAEGLVRSGVGHLTIVDSDLICITNINRQVQAMPKTVGKSKVDVLKKRLLEINPKADITAIHKVFDRKTQPEFDLSAYDYIIDAIDRLSAKVELIAAAKDSGATLYSAMGASNKLDPSGIKIDSIWNTNNCRLGRFVRKRLRRRGYDGDFLAVYSEELLPILKAGEGGGSPEIDIENGEEGHGRDSSKKQNNGSAVHITASFGFFLAGLIIKDIYSKNQAKR